MRKVFFLAAVAFLFTATSCLAEGNNLLLDDFEISVTGGLDGTVDFGSGNGSSVQVTGVSDIKNSGNQALKVVYDAVPGGYIYVARGSGLDARNANWTIKPSDVKWEEYSAISFYVYGTDSKAKIAFDIKDNGGEIWRFITRDNLISQELIEDYMVKDSSTAPRAVQLLLITRFLERICDHTTNIAEDVIYMVQAEVVKHHPERLKDQ